MEKVMNLPPHADTFAAAKFLVFDCETVRCPSAAPVELRPDGTEKFPSAPECRVVSLRALTLDGAGKFLTAYDLARDWRRDNPGASDDRAEDRLVYEWNNLLKTGPALCLVSWNGRRFDLPVLAARAMRYGRQDLHFDQSFRYRYSKGTGPGTHLDVMDQLSDYGSAQNASLDAYARAIGLPGKVFGEGDSVQAMHDAGRLEEIGAYCLTDVVQTAFLLLRYLLVTGAMTRTQYRAAAADAYALARPLFGGARVDLDVLLLTVDDEKTKKERP